MRLLFDQNLSFKLVRLLADVFPDSVHVRDSDLLEADDAAIWRYAAERDLIIVSKDSDFHQMSLLHGHPPKTVWLRVGNGPTSTIAARLREHHATMRRFHADPRRAPCAGVRTVRRSSPPEPKTVGNHVSSILTKLQVADCKGPSSAPARPGWGRNTSSSAGRDNRRGPRGVPEGGAAG